VQATLNVLTGSRYTQVPDEMKKYALGYYGDLLAPVDPDVLDRIVDNGSKLIPLVPPTPEPALPALRERHPQASDEDLLLWHSFPEEIVANMFSAIPDETDYSGGALQHLLEEVVKRPDLSRVFVSNGTTTLDIRGR
jgi:oxaloacetate decarboxylase alpha subunit